MKFDINILDQYKKDGLLISQPHPTFPLIIWNYTSKVQYKQYFYNEWIGPFEFYRKNFKGNFKEIRFSDLPKDLQEDDIIDIRREESFYSENTSFDAYTELLIIREQDETEEEYQKRISDNELFKEESKRRRYETYLRLKSEFEPETP
jgi:hypothetical protein